MTTEEIKSRLKEKFLETDKGYVGIRFQRFFDRSRMREMIDCLVRRIEEEVTSGETMNSLERMAAGILLEEIGIDIETWRER